MIYFDNAATTQVAPEVREAMQPFLNEAFANPSSPHSGGRRVKEAVERARAAVAGSIGAPSDAITFTSGGTEANNAAIKGVAFAKKKGHIIVSAAEHHSTIAACEWLQGNGFSLTVLQVGEDSRVDPQVLRQAMRADTVLVTCMWVNNETGAVNPISELCAIAHEGGALFHTDAVQAAPLEPVDAVRADVDLLTISGHKFYGPKGVGALYCKAGVAIEPLLHGGQQEGRRRGGTEAVPAIVGLGKAAELLMAQKPQRRLHAEQLRRCFLSDLGDMDMRVNGSEHGTPSILNIGFARARAEAIVVMLDHKGILASMGAACNSQTIEPSHVLRAMRVPEESIDGSIRISLGAYNTQDEAKEAARILKLVVARQRAEA